jgi:uncharacterized protein (DUF427 family)
LITNTIPCWLISVKNRSPSSENVMCLATQQSRDLVLANHRIADSERVLVLFEPCHNPMAYFPEN